MSGKPVVPRERALRDLEEAVDFYVREAGPAVALDLIGMVESAYRTIAGRPAIGSPRYAYELELPGLRTQRVKRFPYLVFYFEHDDRIDVWRLLHAHRDIPALMHGPLP